jgi:Tol biopolymer transport system component
LGLRNERALNREKNMKKTIRIVTFLLALAWTSLVFAQNPQVKGIHHLFNDDITLRGQILYRAMGSGGGFFQHPAWSPDGSKIAFDFTVYDIPLSIWLTNSDGTGLKKISTGDDDNPTWSPDGNRIAFVRNNVVSDKFEIWIMDADGTNQVFLIEGFAPAWSSKGKIGFIRQDNAGNNDIWMINPDGTGLARLTNTLENEDDLAWSPDGNIVAFSRSINGKFNIWKMDADGTNQKQLTMKGGMIPTWSPDGLWIAFESDRWRDKDDLWVVRSDKTEEVVHLSTGFRAAGSPVWSPDGKKILFEGVREFKVDSGIFMMTLQ